MYKTEINKIRNAQTIQIYIQPKDEEFEVWIFGSSKDEWKLLAHFLNPVDPRSFFQYAKDQTIEWVQCSIEDEHEAISKTIHEQEEPELENITQSGYFLDSVWEQRLDRKTFNQSKKQILGKWTNGENDFEVTEGSVFKVNEHAEFGFFRGNKDAASWEFSSWQLIVYDKQGGGGRIGIWRCDEKELHITANDEDLVVEIYHRK